MKNLLRNTLIILTAFTALWACKDEKSCTEEFVTVNVTITNFDGTPATLDELYLIRMNTNDTIPITNDGGASYTLVDDNFELSGNESFLLEGFKNGQLLLSEAYVFGRDDCHIFKVSGKNTIALD